MWAVLERPAGPLVALLRPERPESSLPIDESSSLTDCPDHMDVGALRDCDLDLASGATPDAPLRPPDKQITLCLANINDRLSHPVGFHDFLHKLRFFRYHFMLTGCGKNICHGIIFLV